MASSASQVQEGNLKWSSGAASFPSGQITGFDSLRFPLSTLRPLLSEAYEGLYYLEVLSGGQVVDNAIPGPQDSCTFKVGSKDGGMYVCLVCRCPCVIYLQASYKLARESILPGLEERWMIVMGFLGLY